MTVHSEEITIKGRQYKIELLEHWSDKSLCWNAYKKNPHSWGSEWIKIPCWTDYEERRFPKSVGLAANAVLQRYKDAHKAA